MRILNLYAGIGGNRKNWSGHRVTAVEYDAEIAAVYKRYFPEDEVVIGDAVAFLLKHWRDYDFIWASPGCQTHSRIRFSASKRGSYEAKLPDMSLYQLIIFLRHFCKDKLWVVENVKPYYTPLIEPTVCLDRHYLWSNFPIMQRDFSKPSIKHNEVTGKTTRFGLNLEGIKMTHRKDQVIRNCVNPEIGEHVLECALFEASR